MVQHRYLDKSARRGFTLVEMLVALAVLTIILLAVTQMVGSTGKLWKNTTAKISSFQGARAGFQLLTSELQQATVNTYLDYFDSSGKSLVQYTAAYESGGGYDSRNLFRPLSYGRQSELHFISGDSTTLIPTGTITGATVKTHAVFFQCPQGVNQTSGLSALNKLLNAEGFFVEFGSQNTSANSPPTILASPDTYRYRLMQFVQTTENFSVYNYPSVAGVGPNDWFVQPLKNNHNTTVRIVADNVIALILWPKMTDSATDTLTSNTYSYDSRLGGNPWIPTPDASGVIKQPLQMNQMPPLIRVAMVALDEPSAAIMQGNSVVEPTEIQQALVSTSNPDHPGSPLFTKAQYMDSDLTYLQSELAGFHKKIRFQVYSTTISVRSAKFSTN